MNNLLFTALLIALIYYFFFYLPNQKKVNPNPPTKLTHSQSTQTDPNPNETEPGSQSVKFPSETVIKCPETLTIEDNQELGKTLDNLIKGMQDLTKDLEK